MGPRFLLKQGGREKGGTVHFLFIHSWPTGRLRPHLPRATSWQRCPCPPFRAPDARLRGDCRARTALPARGDRGARDPATFAEDVHGAMRGSLEAVRAGRVTPDNLVRRAKTGTSGGAGTASSSL